MNAFEQAIEAGDIDIGEYAEGIRTPRHAVAMMLAPDDEWIDDCYQSMRETMRAYANDVPECMFTGDEWRTLAYLVMDAGVSPLIVSADVSENADWICVVFGSAHFLARKGQ